jgi:hypothetical protein
MARDVEDAVTAVEAGQASVELYHEVGGRHAGAGEAVSLSMFRCAMRREL